MVDVLGPLSARPPTPPRTASRMLSEKGRTEDSPVTVQTPNESSILQNDSTGAPSSRQLKRVNFSPWPKFIKPPSFTNSNTKSKVLLPSNERKPARSILKATNSPGPVSTIGVVSYSPETFAMLLESVTQQLAGESTSSRIDAYMQFFGALRAYENLPTEEEIARKLGLIAEFIQRDISRDLTKGGPLDTNLVIQALKLSVVLVWHSQISSQLPDDFKLFLVEHSVSCLEDGKLPKSVMTHYLTVLSTQKFPTRIITNARATRILEMLHDLTDRVKGNSVVSQRLMIYDRLFEQNKSTFISQCALWMDHLLSGLLHQIKNVRLSALELGFNAYLASGPNSPLSKTLRDVFDRPISNNRKLVSEICERMSRMMANPDTGDHVPQIWGVITLLLRNKRFNIDQWQHFRDWVLVLQRCFNCSDPEIKSKAHGNWNRFVLVVNLSETTSRSLLRMLSKPIISQFERKKHDRSSQPSQLAVASYYNLLYYAFRPDASFQQFDTVWEEYIASPSSKIFATVPSLSDRLAHALSNMMWSSHPPKAWSENRVNEPKRVVAEELPPLDCKWVRSRIFAVLKVFEDILKSSVWNPEIEKSNIAAAWISLSRALAFAASKEITPSPESMQTVAQVLGLLQRLWNAGPSSLNATEEHSMDAFFERFGFLSTTMVLALGSVSFTEKLLLKTANSTYQAATPTHRHSKTNNNPDAPIFHLLRLVSNVSEASGLTPAYSRLVNDIVQAASHGKLTRGSRLDILRQCADLSSNESELHFGVQSFGQIVWTSNAQLSVDCLCYFPTESIRAWDGSISRDYDNLLKILSAGLRFSDIAVPWDRLLDAFIRVLRSERGDRAIVTLALEPLAELLMSYDIRSIYSFASSIINHSLPISFPNSDEEPKGNTLAPPFPSKSIELTKRALFESYTVQDSQEGVTTFIESLVALLGSGALSFRALLLDQLQQPIGLYLKDEQYKLTVESAPESRISTTYRALTTAVLNVLQFLPHNPSTLQGYEGIIGLTLNSTHISAAKRFADFVRTSYEAHQTAANPTVSRALRDFEARVNSQMSSSGASSAPSRQSLGKANVTGYMHTKSQAAESWDVSAKDISVKSRLAYILDAPTETHPPRLESTGTGSDATGPTWQQTEELQSQQALPQAPHNIKNENGMAPSGQQDSTRHREMFSMIDNLRSSSPPTATPRELGFLTPPHLRSLRNEESGSEIPQTPTIPAVQADNEEGFLGSSPTPAIRGRASSVASAIPPSVSAVADSMDVDPPSSPPEPEQRVTDSQQSSPSKFSAKSRKSKDRKRNRSRRSKAPSKGSQADVPFQAQPAEEDNGKEAEPILRTRLRSGKDKSPAATPAQQDQEAQSKMGNDTSHNPVIEPPSHNGNIVRLQVERADAVDSASEDTDTQAMSQLENDLVYAVDVAGDEPTDKEIEDYTIMCATTRKRDRPGQNWGAIAKREKEQRRSSRISFTAASTPAVEGSQDASSKKRKLSSLHQETPPPATSSTKKRKQATFEIPNNSTEPNQSEKDHDAGKEPETQGSQKRRSGRISGAPAPDIPEETPAPKKSSPKKSPRPSSSRKQNKKQKSRRSETGRFLPADVPSDKETTAGESSLEEPRRFLEVPTADQEQQRESHSSQPPVTEVQPSEETEPKEPEDVQMSEVQETLETEAQPIPMPMPEPEAETSAPQPQPQHLEPEIETQALSEHISTPEHEQSALPEPVPEEPQPKLEPQLQPEPEQHLEPEPEREPEPESALPPQPQPRPNASIATSLRSVIERIRLSSLDRNEVKEVDDLLFDLRFEMHEAYKRKQENATATPSQS
ncbi:putative telomere length regulator protein (Rif1) [Aspergillus undulatus]|uniref:putative telomere length regulator protein (Rif1) n=1 Tax=Aspergillus undulatus TaxID=1810928 RepID=UPI003CCDD60D